MRLLVSLFAAVLLLASAQAQEAVLRNGRPALKFTDMAHPYFTFVEDASSADPALRFLGIHSLYNQAQGCTGSLYVSAARVWWEPQFLTPRCAAGKFDVERAGVTSIRLRYPGTPDGNQLLFNVKDEKHLFETGNEIEGKWRRVVSDPMAELLVRSLNDFSGAYEEFKRLTASLQPKPQLPAAPASGTLVLSSQPVNVQVYVDDVFKGMTSAEGRLVIEGLAPGAHRVRMNLIGYTESARTVELKPGETATVEAKLEPAGPKPLALAEVEEALTNGLPPKGITKLVNQYGVDFALTKPIEQRLRSKGADSDLLVAIATNKK